MYPGREASSMRVRGWSSSRRMLVKKAKEQEAELCPWWRQARMEVQVKNFSTARFLTLWFCEWCLCDLLSVFICTNLMVLFYIDGVDSCLLFYLVELSFDCFLYKCFFSSSNYLHVHHWNAEPRLFFGTHMDRSVLMLLSYVSETKIASVVVVLIFTTTSVYKMLKIYLNLDVPRYSLVYRCI
jgi:hypothetical protein